MKSQYKLLEPYDDLLHFSLYPTSNLRHNWHEIACSGWQAWIPLYSITFSLHTQDGWHFIRVDARNNRHSRGKKWAGMLFFSVAMLLIHSSCTLLIIFLFLFSSQRRQIQQYVRGCLWYFKLWSDHFATKYEGLLFDLS